MCRTRIRLLICLLIFVAKMSLVAQTQVNLLYYQFNQQFYNPAVSGTDINAKASIFYQNLGLNSIEGAPETLGASFYSPLSLSAGIGLNFVSDRFGGVTNNDLILDLSYRVPIKATVTFGMGVRLNYSSNRFDPVGSQLNDPLFLAERVNKVLGGFGFFLFDKTSFFGLSIPRLSFGQGDIVDATIFDLANNEITISAGRFLVIDKSTRTTLRLSGMAVVTKDLPVFYNLGALVLFQDRIYAGMGINSNWDLAGYFGLRFDKKYEVAFAYSPGFKDAGVRAGNILELSLSYSFSRKKQLFSRASNFGGIWRKVYY